MKNDTVTTSSDTKSDMKSFTDAHRNMPSSASSDST